MDPLLIASPFFNDELYASAMIFPACHNGPAPTGRIAYLLEKFPVKYSGLDPARGNTINPSAAANVLGENKYQQNPRDEFIKRIYNIRTPTNIYMQHGAKYESHALEKFRQITGARTWSLGLAYHEQHSQWISGSVDALAEMPNGKQVVVEIKCPYKRSFKEGIFIQDASDVPRMYNAQIQLYMSITGLDTCMFVQYRPFMPPRRKEKISIIQVDYNPLYVALALPILHKFWCETEYWKYYYKVPYTRAGTYIRCWWKLHKFYRAYMHYITSNHIDHDKCIEYHNNDSNSARRVQKIMMCILCIVRILQKRVTTALYYLRVSIQKTNFPPLPFEEYYKTLKKETTITETLTNLPVCNIII